MQLDAGGRLVRRRRQPGRWYGPDRRRLGRAVRAARRGPLDVGRLVVLAGGGRRYGKGAALRRVAEVMRAAGWRVWVASPGAPASMG